MFWWFVASNQVSGGASVGGGSTVGDPSGSESSGVTAGVVFWAGSSMLPALLSAAGAGSPMPVPVPVLVPDPDETIAGSCAAVSHKTSGLDAAGPSCEVWPVAGGPSSESALSTPRSACRLSVSTLATVLSFSFRSCAIFSFVSPLSFRSSTCSFVFWLILATLTTPLRRRQNGRASSTTSASASRRISTAALSGNSLSSSGFATPLRSRIACSRARVTIT